MKLDKLGWVVAAALAGAICGMGFQGSSPKFATVDMAKVFTDSDFTTTSNTQLQDYLKTRVAVMQFLKQNPPMLPGDAQKYPDLALKTNRSSAEDADFKRIQSDALAATTKQRDLSLKASPSQEELNQLADFRARAAQNETFGQQLEQQYDQDLQTKRQSLHDQAMDKVRQSVKDVAQKQGYTVVFSVETAPYAANDITPDALKMVKH